MNVVRVTVALMLTVGTGLVHGLWTNRWGLPAELVELGKRMESVPMVLADWRGTALEFPKAYRAMAGADAYLSRRYSNSRSGASVTALLLAGLPGKISTHTPDVCYSSAGYKLGSIANYEFRYGPDARHTEFKTAVATLEGPAPSQLRIFWSWNAGKMWSTPNDPRWEFAREPILCKLYVVRETAGVTTDPADDPCTDFIDVFLPELDRDVFSLRKSDVE
jgi:hypothetical protein